MTPEVSPEGASMSANAPDELILSMDRSAAIEEARAAVRDGRSLRPTITAILLGMIRADTAPKGESAPSALAEVGPYVIRKLTEACEEAENPKGMSVHDGVAHVDASHLRRVLAALRSATKADATPGVKTP